MTTILSHAPFYCSPFIALELLALEAMLQKQGFIPYPESNAQYGPETLWSKRLDGVLPLSSQSEKPPALHVILTEWHQTLAPLIHLNICGMQGDGIPLEFKLYALHAKFVCEHLDMLTLKLVRAWTAAGSLLPTSN
ncbi:MAG: hypothetical protein Q7U16_12925 [Agitococcus sp.]|nr:hypothetical protein [Agitococcus sp.]